MAEVDSALLLRPYKNKLYLSLMYQPLPRQPSLPLLPLQKQRWQWLSW